MDIAEQVENSTSKIGKFNTADDLLAAYNALEREFTKRCQLIKELQTELETSRAQAESTPSDNAISGEQPPESNCEQTFTASDNPALEQTTDTDDNSCRNRAEESKSCNDACSAVAVSVTDDNGVLDELLRCAQDYADVLSAVPEIMDACITRYKQKLMDARIGAVSPTGMAVIVPAKRPRSLADAKLLADAMLK